jgi:precorrin-2/cobalt-factor-2 C20-methyltransferase
VPTVFAAVRQPGARSYALELAKPFLKKSGQRQTVLAFPCEAHVETIMSALAEGDAAFLTEGDPLFYSSFIGVLRVLRNDYPAVMVRVVPGVSSPMAAAAEAGLPLVADDQRLAVLPAMYALDMLPDVLHCFDTVVLMKVSPVLPAVLERLDAMGLGDTAVHVRRVGRPGQSVLVGSSNIRQAPAAVVGDYFSLLIVQRRT